MSDYYSYGDSHGSLFRRAPLTRQQRRVIRTVLFYATALLVTAVWLVPFVIAVFTSLKTFSDIMAGLSMWRPPTAPTIQNFFEVWETGMAMFFRNTTIITVPSVIGALGMGSLGAYALAFHRFRGARVVLMVFIAGMLIPFQMLLIPVFRFSNLVGLYDTWQGLILFHIAFQTGFCTFFLRGFMKTMPVSILQSARIDGARELLIYRRLVLPLTKPALAALAILQFTWIWNDYLWGLVLLQSDNLKPITLGLVGLQGQFVSSYNLIAAGAIIAASLPIAVFLAFQRHFIHGLTLGAVKE